VPGKGAVKSTSMSRFSSILTALPKMKIHCAKFANSHILRRRSSRLGSLGPSGSSKACLPRFAILKVEFAWRCAQRNPWRFSREMQCYKRLEARRVGRADQARRVVQDAAVVVLLCVGDGAGEVGSPKKSFVCYLTITPYAETRN
jgi:hypothetical protein